MIYRNRVKKSGYSIKLLPNNLKIELGKRVWYFPFMGVGKPLHTLIGIKDVKGNESVTHTRRKDRVTVNRHVNLTDLIQELTGIETFARLSH